MSQTRAAAPAEAAATRDARAHADVDNPDELTEYDRDGKSDSVTSSTPMIPVLSLTVACAFKQTLGPDRRSSRSPDPARERTDSAS